MINLDEAINKVDDEQIKKTLVSVKNLLEYLRNKNYYGDDGLFDVVLEVNGVTRKTKSKLLTGQQ